MHEYELGVFVKLVSIEEWTYKMVIQFTPTTPTSKD